MKIKYLAIIIIYILTSVSCKKYLELKPDKSLVTPQTTDDLQGLLDAPNMYGYAPAQGQAGSDDYYLIDATFNSLSLTYRNIYRWDSASHYDVDYTASYQNINSANLVLDYADKVSSTSLVDKTILKGQAYFMRALNLFQLTQIYTLPYDGQKAASQIGLPIKTTSDINSPTSRANLKMTFDQIISDYQLAVNYLPSDLLPLTRGNKIAAYAGLAQTSLVMGDYGKARDYADSCLSLKNTLLNYNDLDSTSEIPIAIYNNEVILQNDFGINLLFYKGYAKVDTNLYNSYAPEDLRRGIFYGTNADGSHYFKGGYDGNYNAVMLFSGLATDEVYLIKAECEARIGSLDVAMHYLNTLMENRTRTADFSPLVATTANQALKIILAERRKELAFRQGARWMDLRRFSLDPNLAQSISRTIAGQIYTLSPHDLRYACLLPLDVIKLSGIDQNKR